LNAKIKSQDLNSPTLKPIFKILAEEIKEMGIDTVFVLMSDDMAPLVSALPSLGIQVRRARHENNTIAMAEGYAAATGKLGVAIIGCGPSVSNSVNGALYAQRSSSPVLIIYGDEVASPLLANALGPHYKRFNLLKMLETLEIPSFHPFFAKAVQSCFCKATQEALQGKAVALALPKDLQYACIEVADVEESQKKSSLPLSQQR